MTRRPPSPPKGHYFIVTKQFVPNKNEESPRLWKAISYVKTTNLFPRSMNIGPLLDEKLAVKYTSGVDEAERRKKKRKEKFQAQVAKAVQRMQVKFDPLNYLQKHI